MLTKSKSPGATINLSKNGGACTNQNKNEPTNTLLTPPAVSARNSQVIPSF